MSIGNISSKYVYESINSIKVINVDKSISHEIAIDYKHSLTKSIKGKCTLKFKNKSASKEFTLTGFKTPTSNVEYLYDQLAKVEIQFNIDKATVFLQKYKEAQNNIK